MDRVGLSPSLRRLRHGFVGWILCGLCLWAGISASAWAEKSAKTRLRGDIVELRLQLERAPRDVTLLVKLSKKLILFRSNFILRHRCLKCK